MLKFRGRRGKGGHGRPPRKRTPRMKELLGMKKANIEISEAAAVRLEELNNIFLSEDTKVTQPQRVKALKSAINILTESEKWANQIIEELKGFAKTHEGQLTPEEMNELSLQALVRPGT